MELLNLMKSRYSARSYDSKTITKKDLETILEAGRVAPTAANRQTQKILVVDTKEGIEKIGKSTSTNNSPLIMLVCSKTSDSWVNPYDGRDMNDIDCSIISTHMMLMAKKLGIDSLWINWFDPNVLHNEFNIPKDYKIVNIMQFGYSDVAPQPVDRHTRLRKPITETVCFNNFN